MLFHAILSTPVFDMDGFLPLDFEPDTTGIFDFTRRAAIVPTLDGGAVVDNMGVFDATNIVTLTTRVDDETAVLLAALCRVYERLTLSTEEGVFSVVPMRYGRTAAVVTLQLHVVERLA
jgi:hypothetical protein